MNNPRTTVCRGQMALSAPTDTVTSTVDTYNQMSGTFTDSFLNLWSLNTDGTLTYEGPDGGIFLFNGASDLAVDKASKITYGLYVNDLLVSGAETPHDFVSASKVGNISITRITQLNNGDTINIYLKSDTIDTTVSVQTLFITFWGQPC